MMEIKKSHWRITALLTAVVMAMGLLASCGDDENSSSGTSSNTSSTQEGSTQDKSAYDSLDITGETLTIWSPMDSTQAELAQDFNDFYIWQKIHEATGVNTEWSTASAADTNQAFMTLVASKDLPDIIMEPTFSASSYPGGPDKAVEDGVYLRLNELIADYAPDYLNAISDPETYKLASTDGGNLVYFYMVDTYNQESYHGPMYRKDWLDKLGLEVPTTMDEVHDVLVAFRDELNVEGPLYPGTDALFTASHMLLSAYGVNSTYFVDDGTVKYGPIEDGFRQYLETMNAWYDEGLMAEDFPTRSDANGEITTDKCGMWQGNFWNPGTWKATSISSDEFEVVAGPYVTLNKGEKVGFAQVNNVVDHCPVAITSSCEKPEVAAKWLNFMYTEEGFYLCNWGTEGETYTMVDGEPQYTEFFTENANPRGLDFQRAQYFYLMGGGPFLRQWDREMWTYGQTGGWDMMKTWDASSTKENYYPKLVTMTPEEGDAFNVIETDATTFVNQQTIAFITGAKELNDDTWNEHVETLKSMGIDEAIGYKQAAYDRFQAR